MKNNCRQGFSLIEVMVATAMIASMIIALLSFVSIGADVWRRADQTITLSSEAEMINTYLRNATLATTKVILPAVGGSGSTFQFDLPVATGTPSVPSQYYAGSATIRVTKSGTGPSWNLVATYTALSNVGTNKVTFNTIKSNILAVTAGAVDSTDSADSDSRAYKETTYLTETSPSQIDPTRLVATLSSRIASINFERPQKNILKMTLKLVSIVHEGEYSAFNATPSFDFIAQYFLPNL
ncbi:MAG: prepilin-type N-terminal cleavage/methylation domain-containing protein [Candidatus Ozemobacteraceae bacterium]